MSLERISYSGLTAEVDTMGAQLMSLKVGDAEYLWQGDPS